MDLISDDREELSKMLQKKKWDRKKKKYVSTQSLIEKNKKIKTESGQYISASYNSNLYSKWLKNSKKIENEDEEDSTENNKKSKRFFSSSINSPTYLSIHIYFSFNCY
jgi:ATP-dependent RNA helicase DDX54/DBP10